MEKEELSHSSITSVETTKYDTLFGCSDVYSNNAKKDIANIKNNPKHWMNNLPSYREELRLDTSALYTITAVLTSESLGKMKVIYITPKTHPRYFDGVLGDNVCRLALIYTDSLLNDFLGRPSWVSDLIFEATSNEMNSLCIDIMNDAKLNKLYQFRRK